MARGRGKTDEVDYLKRVAAGVKDMTLVEAMEEEKLVPTILTGYNRATGVGAHPLGCVVLIHGPEQVGKTVLGMAIVESLRRFGHVSMVYDSDFAGEKTWYGALTPKSGFKRTADLNELEQDMRGMLKRLIDGKAAKKKADRIPKDVGCAFLIDSLTDLMPREVLEKIDEEGVEKQFPAQASFVSLWTKWLVPQLFRTGSSAIVVLQERTKLGARANQKQYKVTLGQSVQYKNRLRMRVTHSKKILMGKKVVGMECHVKVENNKLVGTTYEEFKFYTSNGKGDVPKGLDLVREAVEEAKTRGVAESKGNAVNVKFGGERFLHVTGGWADLRERLQGDEKLFGEFVGKLNGEVS